MNYTYVENVETSAYSLTINTDANFIDILKSDNFEIGIFDEITGLSTTINKNNFQLFGVNDKSTDLNARIENSLIKNKGLLVYTDSNNVLKLKMLIACSNGEESIGYNSSKLSIWLDDKANITTYACILPKLLRSDKLIQYDPSLPDPVLPEPDLRQSYSYDDSVPAQDRSLVQPITADYECGDPDGIYVNTDISVPTYYSTVSALLRLKDSEHFVNFSSVSSFLYDDDSGSLINIPYDKAGPFESLMTINGGYSANVEYYTYTQYLSAAGDQLYKNNLHLILTTSAETNVQNLLPLGITIVSCLPENKTLAYYAKDGTLEVKITNPNLDYLSYEPEVELTGDAEYELDSSTKVFDPNTGTLTFTIKNIETKTTADLKITTYLNIADDPFRPSYLIKQQTYYALNTEWKYEHEPELTRLTITHISVTPESQELDIKNPSGTLFVHIVNENENYKRTPPTIEILTNGVTDDPTIKTSSYDPEYGVLTLEIENIKTDATCTIQIYAYLDLETPDWSEDEVKTMTEETSTAISWSYNNIVLERFDIEYSDYIPEERDINDNHLIVYNDEGILTSGGVKVTITNPNSAYVGEDYPISIEYDLPDGAVSSTVDDSLYLADGSVSFNVWNIQPNRDNQSINLDITAYGNFTAAGYDYNEIKEFTSATKVSDNWRYEQTTPDIYPFDELRKFSIYSVSDIEVNGGYIGSRQISCKNLTVNNGGVIDSPFGLASGCKFTSNGNNTFNGNISATDILINNPSTFNCVLYAANSLDLNGVTIPSAYTADNCVVTLRNGAQILNEYRWENPECPELGNIPTTEFDVGEGYYRNGQVFGEEGQEGTVKNEYHTLDINNDQPLHDKTVTFWPGIYTFDTIKTTVDSKLILNTHEYAKDDDGSVYIQIKNVADFGNNTIFNSTSKSIYDFRLYYGGTDNLTIGVGGVNQAGTVISPLSTVTLQNNAEWTGNIWANKMVLQQGAKLMNS